MLFGGGLAGAVGPPHSQQSAAGMIWVWLRFLELTTVARARSRWLDTCRLPDWIALVCALQTIGSIQPHAHR